MKILFLTFGPDLVASSRTRVYQYLPFFRSDAIQYKVINNFSSIPYILSNNISSDYLSRKKEGIISKHFKTPFLRLCIYCSNILNVAISSYQIFRTTIILFVFKYDIIFIQKVILPLSLIKLYKSYNKMIVFDFDDAIYLNDGFFRNKKQFDKLIPLYDLVIVENSQASQYTQINDNKNVITITGPIDTNRYSPGNHFKTDIIIIGWIGSPTTQSYLYSIKDTLDKLCQKYPHIYFFTIGAGKLEFGNIKLIQKKWDLNSEVELLREFDIGIMPLPDDDWSRGKGGYKLLQYMSIGIPCCASPVGINAELIREGENGFLVNTAEEWYNKLSLLIENEQLRISMGNLGRKIAEDNYSFQAYYPKLKNIMVSTLNQRKLGGYSLTKSISRLPHND